MTAQVDDFGTVLFHSDVSGFSAKSCVVLGHRHEYEKAMLPAEMESWVIWLTKDSAESGRVEFPFGCVGWLSGIWLAPGGMLYVCDLKGSIYALPLQTCREQPWKPAASFPKGTYLHGLWGLQDDHVLCWATDKQGAFLLRGSGANWERSSCPEMEVILVRGTSPDSLVAAGNYGDLFCWNGKTWTDVTWERESISGLHVVDEGRFWLTTESGKLFEGSPAGLERRAELVSGGLQDVTLWHGDIWVAGGDWGLMRLEGGTLVTVKDNIPATRFDARGDLMMCCPSMIASTQDGAAWRGDLMGDFARMRGAIAPDWEG